MCVWVHVRGWEGMFVFAHVHTCMHVCFFLCVCVFRCMHMLVYVYVCKCVCILNARICAHTCVCVWTELMHEACAWAKKPLPSSPIIILACISNSQLISISPARSLVPFSLFRLLPLSTSLSHANEDVKWNQFINHTHMGITRHGKRISHVLSGPRTGLSPVTHTLTIIKHLNPYDFRIFPTESFTKTRQLPWGGFANQELSPFPEILFISLIKHKKTRNVLGYFILQHSDQIMHPSIFPVHISTT